MRSLTNSKSYEINILNYLELIDITEAIKLGVDIRVINCAGSSGSDIYSLRSGVYSWVQNNKVLLDERDSSDDYSYGGARYNGRTLRGSSRDNIRFFSNFKLFYNSDDGFIQDFSFIKLSSSEIEKYSDHPNYNTDKTPSMLQVFYGLMKKYDKVISQVYGIIPGVIDPSIKDPNER